MALLSSSLAGEVAVRLLFSPLGSKVFARWACFVGGLAVPIYSSFKAIELKDRAEQDHWLVYWTAYGCFSAVEAFSDKILFWVPGYYHAKLLFLIYLQLPLTGGAHHVVSKYLRPILLKHQALLDRIVNGTRADVNNFLLAHLQELKFIKVLICRLISYVYRTAGDICRCLSSSTGGLSGANGHGSSGSFSSAIDHGGNISDTDASF